MIDGEIICIDIINLKDEMVKNKGIKVINEIYKLFIDELEFYKEHSYFLNKSSKNIS